MKAAVFYEKNNLRIEEIPTPSISADEVLIRVVACGVCGTDMHIFDGDKGAADTPAGTVLGHEFAGIVEAVGADISDLKQGDKVSVDPNQLCGRCTFCLNGTGHFCENMIGIGTTVHGGFAEFCAVNRSQVYRLPDQVSCVQGAMNEPVACCLHGIDLSEIKPGDTVLVIGAGMIGQIMVQLARLSGAATVAVIEPIAEKRESAKKYGSSCCIDPAHDDIQKSLQAHGISQIDVVIECAGKPQTVKQAIECAGKKAMVMLFGLTSPDDVVEIRPFDVFRKELTLRASFINPYTQQRALDLIASGRLDVSGMTLPLIPLSELPHLLADKKKRAEGKYIVNPWA